MSVLADLPRRTRIVALLGVVSVAGGGLGLGFAPLVRSGVASAAERRGLEVTVGELSLGAGAIWLKDLELRVPRMPGVKAHVNAVRVGLGWHLNATEISVHGGLLELSGDLDELRNQYAAYRAARPKEAGASASGPRYKVDGVDLTWRSPVAPLQHVWGLSYEREGERESVALDLARIVGSGIEVEARHPQARLTRLNDERQLESMQVEGLDVSVGLEAAPKSLPAGAAVAAPIASKFQPDPARGVRVRAALAELSMLAAHSLPEGAALELEGVRLRLQRGIEQLNVGPSALHVARLGTEVDVSLVPKAEASGTPLELKVSLPLGPGAVRAEVRGGPVSLRSLGVREGDFGLLGVQSASLQASAEVTLAGDGASLAFSGSGVLDQVSLLRVELSPSPLSGIHLGFRARGTTTLDGAKLVLDDGEVSLGDVRLQGNGVLTRNERAVQTHWSGGVPLASCQALLDAAPRGLVPLIAPLHMTGTFAINAELDYDSERANDTRVRLGVANDCRIGQIPADLSPSRFAAAWQREVKGADRLPMEVESGPGSPDWVPIDAISPFMETAVLVCEDGHFEQHHGFDYEAIQNSIRDDLIKGRFVRGASTITMQLARNLYLGKEKTLARKLQEAVLALLLEQELSKRELMELYLNVIEYGPGIYGIGPAARYYFAKRATDLSLGQALYIASILPNPERQHFDKDGRVSAAWTKYLQRLMVIAKKIGRITDEQLTAGLAEQVAFQVADSGGGSPPASAPTPEEGTDTPTELSP
ncbi:MAG TPA: biosynthetic peptidoglycan transglycosylase [Polyangiaceae bacterium]|nr:biosynthetic peptidoglycan transglycosylase [Polyangiaceae bacterium]